MNKYEMILCIVNSGYSELVMDAAREEGARGGTVIHARGTASKDAEQIFHIAIQPDKDIVLILVPAEIKDKVLHGIYRNAGLKSEGKGIAFSVPVDEVVGISTPSVTPVEGEEKAEPEKQQEEQQEENK